MRLYRSTGEDRYLAGARRAADLVVTWIVLWDAPLPEGSTLSRFGFRLTGWMACDAPGAGYIHSMGVLAVPDLVEMGSLTGDSAYFRAAELLHAGCNETVAVHEKDWGYAFPGLQEEGLLISGGSPTTLCSARPVSADAAKARTTRPAFPGFRRSASTHSRK